MSQTPACPTEEASAADAVAHQSQGAGRNDSTHSVAPTPGTAVGHANGHSSAAAGPAPSGTPLPQVRHDWSDQEIRSLYELPFPELLFRAQTVHRQHNDPRQVQLCTLLSIKTGGCPEDCAYCPQSVRYNTGVDRESLMPVEQVLQAARRAKEAGSSRFCMGAAWRKVRDGKDFDRVVEMVRGVRDLGMEACVTLGMLTPEQAQRLAEAGLTAYNHNLDTGPDYYDQIITTRTYDDRLETLGNVRQAGISVCCGGILGMGEAVRDRLAMLRVLASLEPHPESVPINALVRVEGTPMADQPPLDSLEMVRMIATTRIVLPRARVRLSAGRTEMSDEMQALCFLAGANSIFTGEKLLTTPNPGEDRDRTLLSRLGMEAMEEQPAGCESSCAEATPAEPAVCSASCAPEAS